MYLISALAASMSGAVMFRMLDVIDEFTRECLAIRIDRKLTCSSCAACLATFARTAGRS